MNETNEMNEPKTNMDQLKEEAAACGPGCNCSTGTPGRGRWVLGAMILVVAVALAARAAIKDDGVSTAKSDAAFAGVAVPEPASMAMMGLGGLLVGGALVRRRKRKKS